MGPRASIDLLCCGALAIFSTDFLAAQARRFLSVATFWKLVAAIECRVVPPLALDHLPDKAARALIQFFAVNRLEANVVTRSEEHTSELQSLLRISYAVFCLKKKQ